MSAGRWEVGRVESACGVFRGKVCRVCYNEAVWKDLLGPIFCPVWDSQVLGITEVTGTGADIASMG